MRYLSAIPLLILLAVFSGCDATLTADPLDQANACSDPPPPAPVLSITNAGQYNEYVDLDTSPSSLSGIVYRRVDSGSWNAVSGTQTMPWTDPSFQIIHQSNSDAVYLEYKFDPTGCRGESNVVATYALPPW